MKPKEIKAAYIAVHELATVPLPYRAAREIYQMKKSLAAEIDVLAELEKAMVEKYGGQISRGGEYTFPGNRGAAFLAEYEQAMEDDVAIHLPEVDLSAHADALRLSPGALEALDGLVIFERGVDKYGG